MIPSSQSGASRVSALFGVVAALFVGGFLYWLSVTAEPTQLVVEEDSGGGMDIPGMLAFSIEDFTDEPPDSLVGVTLTVSGMNFLSRVGAHSFFVSLADSMRTPYLIHLSGEIRADSAFVPPGSDEAGDLYANGMDVLGTVTMMSDSILDLWEEAGAFGSSGDRSVASFAVTFLEAREVAASGGAGAEEGSGEGPDESEPES